MYAKVRFESRVKEARREKGISQEMLAELVGVSRENIRDIEYGSKAPSVVTAVRISRVLGRTVEELFQVEDEKVWC